MLKKKIIMKRVRPSPTKYIVYLLDISASMTGQEKTMVDAINNNLKSLPKEETIDITIYIFNNTLKQIRNGLLNDITPIEYNEYKCWGSTSLYDYSCDILQDIPQSGILVIATDGADTSSSRYTQEQCKNEMISAQKSRGVTIIYVAEGDDAVIQANKLSISEDYVIHAQDNDLSQTFNSQQVMDIISQSLEI